MLSNRPSKPEQSSAYTLLFGGGITGSSIVSGLESTPNSLNSLGILYYERNKVILVSRRSK